MNNPIPYLFLSLLVLCSCGAKHREPNASTINPTLATSKLPVGILKSEKQKFLVHASSHAFVALKENEAVYHITHADLTPLDPQEYGVEFQYDMPEMTMMINPARVVTEAPGIFKVTYGISMSGLWEFRLRITKAGELMDRIVLRTQVP
jgi:hypothetical protein